MASGLSERRKVFLVSRVLLIDPAVIFSVLVTANRLACALKMLRLFLLRGSFVERLRNLSSLECSELHLSWHGCLNFSIALVPFVQLGDRLLGTRCGDHPFIGLLIHERIWLDLILIQLPWVQVDRI